jgi:N-acetylneuraminic acid mutarotase
MRRFRKSSLPLLKNAVRPLVESLEGRRLLHGTLDLHVNFQPASSSIPGGYLADAGATYADRGNGWVYGWNTSNTANTRDRNVNPDQRFDTMIHTQLGGAKTWELAVANGEYQVHLVAGDASYNDSVYRFNVEGTLAVNGTPTSSKRFVEGTVIVNVTDGRLTISNADGAQNNKLAFVDITSYHAGAELPSVTITNTDASATENGGSGTFTVTRTGSTASPLTVVYKLGGTASNGIDYEQLLGSVTIPAGSLSATIQVKPIDDSVVEPNETVTATVLADDAYTIGTQSAATITIYDNDSTTSPTGVKINFQPTSSAIPSGYLSDGGLAFGDRGNGYSYGWSVAHTADSRDRNLSASPDQRYDTLMQFGSQKWELAVPNGTYSVRVVAGDPGYYDSVYRINAEGVAIISGTPTSATRWLEGQAVVTIADGRLTLTSGDGYKNNKICFVELTPADASTPVLNVSAPDANASENGPTPRSFTITRTGSLDQPLVVYYTIGGSATNGVDYDTIVSPVTIPAGQSSLQVTINPKDDAIAEGTETVTLTLVSQSGYAIGAGSSATIRINDNDTPVGNTIAWSTRASNPVARAEALRAVVDGKLYVFAGFGADGPITRNDVYDPATNTWKPLADCPRRLSHAGVAVVGRDIYVAGGYIGQGTTGWAQQFGTTEVWKYNVDSNAWSAFKALPKAVAGGGLVALGRELHWVGGNNNSRQDIGDHYVLNLDATSAGWSTSTSLPLGRSHLGVVAMGGKIYAIAGQFGNDETLTTQKYVHVWDPANPATWTRLADLPTAISHIASATFVYGNRIITAGGETGHNVPTDLVYAYDPSTNTWAAMTKLPAKRFSGVAEVLGTDIFFTTGSSQTTTWKGVVN